MGVRRKATKVLFLVTFLKLALVIHDLTPFSPCSVDDGDL